MLTSPLYRFFALLLLADGNSIFSKANTSVRRGLFLGRGHGWSRPVVLAFMLCTHAYSCACARICIMRLSHRPLLPVHSVRTSRVLYEGQFRGHKQGSLTDDKRHLDSRRIRQDEAVVTSSC